MDPCLLSTHSLHGSFLFLITATFIPRLSPPSYTLPLLERVRYTNRQLAQGRISMELRLNAADTRTTGLTFLFPFTTPPTDGMTPKSSREHQVTHHPMIRSAKTRRRWAEILDLRAPSTNLKLKYGRCFSGLMVRRPAQR